MKDYVVVVANGSDIDDKFYRFEIKARNKEEAFKKAKEELMQELVLYIEEE